MYTDENVASNFVKATCVLLHFNSRVKFHVFVRWFGLVMWIVAVDESVVVSGKDGLVMQTIWRT